MGKVIALLQPDERDLVYRFMTNGSVHMWYDGTCPDDVDPHALNEESRRVAEKLVARGLLWRSVDSATPTVVYYTQTPKCFDQVTDGYVYGVAQGPKGKLVKRGFQSAQTAYDYARVLEAQGGERPIHVVLMGFPEEPPDFSIDIAEEEDILWPVGEEF